MRPGVFLVVCVYHDAPTASAHVTYARPLKEPEAAWIKANPAAYRQGLSKWLQWAATGLSPRSSCDPRPETHAQVSAFLNINIQWLNQS